MTDMLLVTDWEVADEDDFYLEDEWLIKAMGYTTKEAHELREMAKNKQLFIGYEVPAKSYALYSMMDATQVFIDRNRDVRVRGESCVIANNHEDKWEVGE